MKNEKVKLLATNIVIIIFGIFFCVLKGKAINVLETLISSVMILYGGFCLLLYAFNSFPVKNHSMLLEGMMLFFAGILLEFFPSFFVFIIGLMVLLYGVKSINVGLALKKMISRKWLVQFIVGIVFVVLGAVVVIMYNTTIASNIISILLGILLILFGGVNLVTTLIFNKKQAKSVENETSNFNDRDFTDYKIN